MAKKTIPKPTTLDLETFGIFSHEPPMPVGVSIKKWGRKTKYYAFGHHIENNCCWSEAKEAIQEAYDTPDGILGQNLKFDCAVIEKWFGIPVPPWDKIHDSMFLLFLDDPHQKQLGLKPASERLLDWKPEEQDAVGEWLLKHQPVIGKKLSSSPRSKNYFGGYIALAPGKLVGKYANGDVDRTQGLFKLLYPSIQERGMQEAYDRERRLMPVLLEMEQQGLLTGIKRLRNDVSMYLLWMDKITKWVIKRIKAPADINLDSGAQLMDAMIESGKANPDLVPRTPTGKYQTNKEALLIGVVDKTLLAVLKYRTQLKTCLNTFMKPWLEVAEENNGLIFTTWNQVKSPSSGGSVGTRTGRLSSTPNFQNIPNTFSSIFSEGKRGTGLPKSPFKDLPALPKVRSYIIPFENEVFIDRDYSQQELRILAHFDGDLLLAKYEANPWLDLHDDTQAELASIGKIFERKPVKNTNFGLIYGMGVGSLAERNDMTVEDSKDLKNSILNLYPGLKEMYKEMKVRAAHNIPIATWGGRKYMCEPPKLVKGRMMKFDYKLVNILVQGSAADCTKEAIIRFHDKKKSTWRIVLNVHDQITVSVPYTDYDYAMTLLKYVMESIEFDVPMLSEGSSSRVNWDELEECDTKGSVIIEPGRRRNKKKSKELASYLDTLSREKTEGLD